MRGKPRTPTTVMVKVIDISGYLATALERFNQKEGEKASAMTTSYKWGYVETPKGIFGLCNEGVGDNLPITADNPLEIGLHAEYMKDGSGHMELFPSLSMRLRDTELKALPVLEEVNLAKFIRTFGGRLESNYTDWRKALEKALTPAKKEASESQVTSGLTGSMPGR